MPRIRFGKLLTWVLATELVGVVSSLLAGDIASEYRSLIRPPLSPPGWVFPLVWTILYAMMGIAAYLVAESMRVRPQDRKGALQLYWVQLGVNFLWPIVFFRWEFFFTALVVLLVLDVLVAVLIARFHRIEPVAALLLVPYLVWIIFATYLNLGVWWLN